MVEGEGGLDEAHHAYRALQMAHVRLRRADRQGGRPLGPGTEGGAQCLRFHRVANWCAGAVQFDVLDLVGVDARSAERRVDHLALGVGVRDRQGLARAVVVDGRTVDDAVDAVAVGQGPGEGLEDDERATLAADEAVGTRVEGEAAGVGERPPKRSTARVLSGARLRWTPPARTRLDSPLRRLSTARWTATREEDWPQSTVMLGPRSPSE